MKKPIIKPSIRLTNQQLHLLKIIYKFRFVTANLAAKYRGVNTRTTNESLSILLKSEFVARRYNKTYRLLGKSARYYLAPKSLKILKTDYGLNGLVLHSRYKDKSVGEPFVEHTVDIMTTVLNIRATYPNIFTLFTKAEIADHDYFPQPSPDLYLRRDKASKKKVNKYFIDIFSVGTFLFIIKKRVKQYVEHFESGDWEDDQYPTILLVCPDNRSEQKLLKYIEATLDNNYIDETELVIRTAKRGELLDNNKTTINL